MRVKIESPDGKIYRVDVPQGMKPEDVVEQFGRDMGWGKSRLQDTADTAVITAAGAAKGAKEAVNPLKLFGGLAALGATGPGMAPQAMEYLGTSPQKLAAWAERNAPYLDAARAYETANPGIAKAYEDVTGARITDAPDAAAAKRKAEMTPLRKGLAAAAEIAGGSIPFIAAGPVGPALKFTGASAALGGLGEMAGGDTGKIIGSMLPLMAAPVAGGTRLARRGVSKLGNIAAPFTEKGLQDLADKAILEASGTTAQKLAAAMKDAPLKGQPATLGQRTANRGLLDAEYTLHPKVSGIEDSYRATSRLAGNEMSAMAGTSERQGSEALRSALTGIYQQEKALVTPDVEKVKESLKTIAAKGKAIKAHIKGYTEDLSMARQKWLADAGLGDLKTLAKGKTVTLNEVDDVLSAMKAKVREMPAGSPEKLEVGKFVAHMQDGMEKIVPGMGPAYAQYAQFKADFDSNKLIGKLFARNPDRTFKIAPSDIGDTLRKMPAEAIERVAQMSPEVKKAGRDWLAAAWREKAVTANQDTRVANAPNLAATLKFRQDNDAAFRAFMSPEELAKADKIIEALKGPTLAEYGQRRFGSPTRDKSVKATLLSGMLDKIISRVPGGSMLNKIGGNVVYGKTLEQLDQKIADALLSPEQTIARLLAKEIVKPSPQRARLLAAKLAPVSAAIREQGMQTQ